MKFTTFFMFKSVLNQHTDSQERLLPGMIPACASGRAFCCVLNVNKSCSALYYGNCYSLLLDTSLTRSHDYGE